MAVQAYHHFIVEIQYTVPVDQLGDVVGEHRTFLQKGYNQGWLLYSGPQIPKTGGVIIARAPSLEVLQKFFENDPYRINQVATYRFVQFEPVMQQPFMAIWVE